jgi:hypothetical protein
MAQIGSFLTNAAKVRLLIGDMDDTEQFFNDAALNAFVDLAHNNNLKRAAAMALLTMASNEVMVQKRIKMLDLSTDGPSQAKALRELAQDLRAQADAEEQFDDDGLGFDWAEMVNTVGQYDEFIHKDAQRS